MIRQKNWLSAPINPEFRPNTVPNCGEDLFFWLAIEYGDIIPSNFDENLFFFLVFNRIRGQYLSLKQNFHWISAAFRMRLVKATKASPRGKFYGLSTKYSSPPIGMLNKKQNKKNTTYQDFWDCLLHWNRLKKKRKHLKHFIFWNVNLGEGG